MKNIDVTSRQKIVQAHLMHYFATTADEFILNKDLYLIKSSVGDAYHNAATILQENVTESSFRELLNQITGFYQKKHHLNDFCIWDAKNNSVKSWISTDYRHDPVFSGLFCELNNSPYELNNHDHVTYKIVASNQELNDFFIPFSDGFAFSASVTENLKSYYQKHQPSLSHYVAYYKDQPIASASLFVHDGIAGLYNLAILPDFRNRGIAQNLQRIRLNDALTQKIRYALIQAVPATEHMTEKLSFVKCNEITPLVYTGH